MGLSQWPARQQSDNNLESIKFAKPDLRMFNLVYTSTLLGTCCETCTCAKLTILIKPPHPLKHGKLLLPWPFKLIVLSTLPIITWSILISSIHSSWKCLPRVAFLWSKMPMFQRLRMREWGEPLPQAFQYLILMIWRIVIWIWLWYLHWLQNGKSSKLRSPFFSHFMN